MLDRSEALALFKTIPAVTAVYTAAHDPFVVTLLEATKGQTRDEPPKDFYRVWMTAYRYLQQSPALYRVKKHDKTELGDYKQPLAMLLEQQANEDALNDLLIPPGQLPIVGQGDEYYTVSVRTTTEFI